MNDKGSRESDGGPSCVDKSSHPIQKRGKRKINKETTTPEDVDSENKLKEVLFSTMEKLYSQRKNGSKNTSSIAKSLNSQDTESVVDIFNRVVRNTLEIPVLMKALDTEFIIPPLSTFMMSDLEYIGHILDGAKKYDLVVIDPPWNNKSAKRAKRYKSLSFNGIKSLPVPQVISDGSMVAIWVTNKKRIVDFVKGELFPHWSLKMIAEWYWLKITTAGDLVSDFDSVHKKPYERLLIGLHCNPDSNQMNVDAFQATFPHQKVICSTPCRLHSRKPTLDDFFAGYLPSNPQCLELFARNLLPGWTSWGNEVIKHQNTVYFQKEEKNVPKAE
eukprot:gene4978-21322_t